MEVPTCPACRARYEKYHDAQGRVIQHTPLGYARLYRAGDRDALTHARSYADLRTAISKLDEGAHFLIAMEMNLLVVGESEYIKTADGLQVISELGACSGLHMALGEVQS